MHYQDAFHSVAPLPMHRILPGIKPAQISCFHHDDILSSLRRAPPSQVGGGGGVGQAQGRCPFAVDTMLADTVAVVFTAERSAAGCGHTRTDTHSLTDTQKLTDTHNHPTKPDGVSKKGLP